MPSVPSYTYDTHDMIVILVLWYRYNADRRGSYGDSASRYSQNDQDMRLHGEHETNKVSDLDTQTYQYGHYPLGNYAYHRMMI